MSEILTWALVVVAYVIGMGVFVGLLSEANPSGWNEFVGFVCWLWPAVVVGLMCAAILWPFWWAMDRLWRLGFRWANVTEAQP